jgi:hypothetical protein
MVASILVALGGFMLTRPVARPAVAASSAVTLR